MSHVLKYLTKKDERIISEYSIERVINTTIKLLENMDPPKNELDNEEWSVNLEDWEECKVITRTLWNNARDELFRRDGDIKTAPYPDLPDSK